MVGFKFAVWLYFFFLSIYSFLSLFLPCFVLCIFKYSIYISSVGFLAIPSKSIFVFVLVALDLQYLSNSILAHIRCKP